MEIEKALDQLAEKFGIAVDWSQDIYSYVQDILNRYRTVSIVQDAVIIVLLVLGAILATLVLKYILKYIFKQDRKYIISADADDFISAIIIAACIVFLLIFVPITIVNINDITRWIFVPETQFVKELAKLK